ncbi:MAG: UbiD family decarboxylase [Gammaproteobacteria bacterium]|nr:UbiD family decarboxylase [Gammaproteobacteria bacterium]
MTTPGTGPFDSLRDYVAALESRGRLLRIGAMDQDRFEATGFAYRMIEELGFHGAPAFLIGRVKTGGRWLDGPVLGNLFPGWLAEALAYGVPDPDAGDRHLYRRTREHLDGKLGPDGRWPLVAPREVGAASAPVKEVISVGDAADLGQFPWLQTNPGDAGPYVTAGTVFMEDPELGRNVATYRCQVKGPRRLGVNCEIGQHGWNFIQRAKKRGEAALPAAIVVGVDPITFSIGTSKLAALGEDELAIAGGLRGRPVDLVRCETSPLRVPALAELVIEGEIPTGDGEEEGPYGEVYGYMGLKKPWNFVMHVKAITHRRSPWLVNAFAGVTKLTMSMPQAVANFRQYRRLVPNLVDLYRPVETNGVVLASIDKRLPGEGMAAGQHIAANDMFSKAIIIVDADIDLHNKDQVFHALGTRWQPSPGSLLIPRTKGFPLDPSAPTRWLTSKMIIDATRQLPAEGGPARWPAVSRVLLDELSPETAALVASRWADYWAGWRA